jgi:DeoR/GlpR family transcriptional regulator of sugar metabolism
MTDTALRYESAPARRERILDLVRESGYYSLAVLSRDLGVSDMTVRRDVRKLAEQGLVNVVHGGVSAVTDLMAPVDFRFRIDQHLAAKRAIAMHALTTIPAGAVVGLDAGTTVAEAARQMPIDKRLTVVTHSLPAMAVISRRPGINLIGLGGTFFREGQEFAGALARSLVSQLRLDILLLGAAAVRDGRMWSTNGADVEMKQALMRAADRVILLADSTKFAYSALMMVADLSALTAVITDELITDEAREAALRARAELVIVPLGAAGRDLSDASATSSGDGRDPHPGARREIGQG